MYLFLSSAAGTDAAAGGGSMIIMMVVLIAVFYFLMIRPENKRKKEAEAMRNALKVGDNITTIGGIIGDIVSVKDDSIVLETSSDRVRVEFAKFAVSTNNTAEKEAAKKRTAAAEARKQAKADKKKEARPNALVRFGRRVSKWFRDLKSEGKKVVWPTGKQVFNNTVVVIVCVIVVAIFVAVLDVAFGFLRDLIVSLF